MERYAQITGFTYDGGYADYMIASSRALALVPDQLSVAEAASPRIGEHV